MFSILTTVGMLNMLIAQLSLAYESMADHKVGFALYHPAPPPNSLSAPAVAVCLFSSLFFFVLVMHAHWNTGCRVLGHAAARATLPPRPP
eukprot:2079430-Rhodomonas_salina.2